MSAPVVIVIKNATPAFLRELCDMESDGEVQTYVSPAPLSTFRPSDAFVGEVVIDGQTP